MGKFFDLFPKIPYDISRTGKRHLDLMTDVFFRFKFLDAVKKRKVAYFPYTIKDGETPEIIADKVYGDPEAHWVIMMLNDVIDPYLDWYMSTSVFDKYINDKYGSISAAYNTIHHYEKKISTRMLGYSGNDQRYIFSNTTSQIDHTDIQTDTPFNDLYPTIPYANYVDLAETLFETTTMTNGDIIEIQTTKTAINCYDYENDRNEAKQRIKLIPKESYSDVRAEFEQMVATYNPARRLNFRSVSV